jgi:TonB-linked SusC/RagA family outer membrane protein
MGKINLCMHTTPARKILYSFILFLGFQGPVFSQTLKVTGLVKEQQTSEVLAGVAVTDLQNGNTSVSDENGIFAIMLDSYQDSLVFKALGYKTRKLKTKAGEELIVLLEKEFMYSDTKRQYISRQLETMEKSPETFRVDPPYHGLSGISGRSSSLISNSFSGMPGENPNLNIRGINSMIFNQSPVILLDGTPMENLSDINPIDISEVTILKEASTLAILGGQGANGAVLLQTRRGEVGKNKVSFSAAYGIQSQTNFYKMMTPEQSLEFMQELNGELSGTPEDKSVHFGNSFISDSLFDSSNPYQNDWQKDLFSATPYQNYNLSFSGGTEETRFRVSTSYLNMKGIIAPSEMKRINISFNLDHTISEKLSIGSSMYLAKLNNRKVLVSGSADNGNGILSALAYPSFLPGLDEDGNPFINPLRPEIDNPVANREGHEDYFSRNSAIASFFLNYRIVKGLMFQFNTSGNLALDRRDYFASTTRTFFGRTNGGYSIQSGREKTSWNTEALLNFTKKKETIDFDLVAGLIAYKARNAWNEEEGWGFPTDEVKLLSGAGTVVSVSNMNDYNRMAYITRLSIGLKDRYLIRANLRAEQSSRFADKSETGVFYGVNGSWILSKEEFLNSVNSINHLQINLGYGITGNDGGNLAGLLYPLFATDTIPPLNPDEIHTDLAYPDAGFTSRNIQEQSWEMTSELSAGISSVLFGNKLAISANWYTRSITDLILPDFTQASIIYMNDGELSSNGIELSLNLLNLTQGNFRWMPGVYFNKYSNEVVSTGSFSDGYLLGYNGNSNIIKEGESLYAFWGYKTDGIFQEQADIDNHPSQAGAERGDIRYQNLNTDNVIDENDKDIIGDPLPDFHIGFDNSFALKGFELNILFQGSFGADRLNLVKMQTESANDFVNMSSEVTKRWTPGSNENEIPRATLGTNNTLLSDRFIEKASYLRLKQLSLGYHLPNSIIKSIGLSSAYVYLTGTNLFTISDYSGYDPEASSFDVLGIDYGAYP